MEGWILHNSINGSGTIIHQWAKIQATTGYGWVECQHRQLWAQSSTLDLLTNTKMLPTARPLLKVSALLPQRTLAPASHRFFSCTTQRWNEDQQQPPADQQQQGEETAAPAAEEEQAEPIKLSRRRRRFHEWVKDGSGARFVRPSQGTTNYLGSTVSIVVMSTYYLDKLDMYISFI